MSTSSRTRRPSPGARCGSRATSRGSARRAAGSTSRTAPRPSTWTWLWRAFGSKMVVEGTVSTESGRPSSSARGWRDALNSLRIALESTSEDPLPPHGGRRRRHCRGGPRQPPRLRHGLQDGLRRHRQDGYQVLVTAKRCYPYEAATLMMKGGGGLYMEDVYNGITTGSRRSHPTRRRPSPSNSVRRGRRRRIRGH